MNNTEAIETELDKQQYAAAIYQCAKSYNATYYDKDFEDWKRLTAIHNADIERTAKLFGVSRRQVIHDSSDCYTKNFMYLREIEAEEAKNRGKWSLREQLRADRLARQAAERAAARNQSEKTLQKESRGA